MASTEQRVNAVANVLIQAVECHVNPGPASDDGLLAAVRGLDNASASVLTNLAKGLLLLSGSDNGEGDSDATD